MFKTLNNSLFITYFPTNPIEFSDLGKLTLDLGMDLEISADFSQINASAYRVLNSLNSPTTTTTTLTIK